MAFPLSPSAALSEAELRALQAQIEAETGDLISPEDFFVEMPHATTHKRTQKKKVQTVTTSIACEFCQKRKIRCGGGNPCPQCEKRNMECVYPVPAKRGPKPKLRSPPFDPHSTSAASALDDPNMLQLVQQHTRNSSVGAGAGKAASPVTLSAYEALLQKYNQLKVELEVESRLSQHWRSQFFMHQNAAAAMNSAVSRVRAPEFCERTAQFIAHPSAAVESLLATFREASIFSRPSYRWIHMPEKTIQIFTQFVSMHTDTIRVAFRATSNDVPTLATLFEHAVIFLKSSSELALWDLCDQFQQIALDLIQALFFEREAQTDRTVAQQILFTLVILADYYKFTSGRLGTQQTLKLLAAQIMERFEEDIQDAELLSSIYISCLAGAMTEMARHHWIAKIDACLSKNGASLKNRFMYSFSYVFSGLKACVSSVAILDNFAAELNQAERELAELAASTAPSTCFQDNLRFYTSWIEVLRAEIFYRLGQQAESDKWIQKTCVSFSSIQSDHIRSQLRGLVKFCAEKERDVAQPLHVFRTLAEWLGLFTNPSGTSAISVICATAFNQPEEFPPSIYDEDLSLQAQLQAGVRSASGVLVEDLSEHDSSTSATSPIGTSPHQHHSHHPDPTDTVFAPMNLSLSIDNMMMSNVGAVGVGVGNDGFDSLMNGENELLSTSRIEEL